MQRGIKRSNKNWIEYAQEKEVQSPLPQIASSKESLLSIRKEYRLSKNSAIQSVTRKQLLAQMMEKRKKSMVARYSTIMSDQNLSARMPSDSQAFAKELEGILKDSKTTANLA